MVNNHSQNTIFSRESDLTTSVVLNGCGYVKCSYVTKKCSYVKVGVVILNKTKSLKMQYFDNLMAFLVELV